MVRYWVMQVDVGRVRRRTTRSTRSRGCRRRRRQPASPTPTTSTCSGRLNRRIDAAERPRDRWPQCRRPDASPLVHRGVHSALPDRPSTFRTASWDMQPMHPHRPRRASLKNRKSRLPGSSPSSPCCRCSLRHAAAIVEDSSSSTTPGDRPRPPRPVRRRRCDLANLSGKLDGAGLQLPGHLRAEGHLRLQRRGEGRRRQHDRHLHQDGLVGRQEAAWPTRPSTSPAPTRRSSPRRRRAFGRPQDPVLPDRGWPHRRGLQPDGRRRAQPERRHARQDLPGPDHHLE